MDGHWSLSSMGSRDLYLRSRCVNKEFPRNDNAFFSRLRGSICRIIDFHDSGLEYGLEIVLFVCHVFTLRFCYVFLDSGVGRWVGDDCIWCLCVMFRHTFPSHIFVTL